MNHPYLKNYSAERKKLVSQANSLRIVVERKGAGSVLDAAYLDTLRHVNDDLFLLPGVVRGQLKSLWTPSTRWTAVTEHPSVEAALAEADRRMYEAKRAGGDQIAG